MQVCTNANIPTQKRLFKRKFVKALIVYPLHDVHMIVIVWGYMIVYIIVLLNLAMSGNS